MRCTVLLWTLSILLQGSKLLAFSLTGSGNCQYGDAQCNVCLKNVKQSFNNVAKEGSYLGFAMGDSNDVSNSNHWQGVARLMSDSGRYLALTTGKHSSGGHILRIVKMGSRSDDGQAFGTNKNNKRKQAPPSNDKVVKTIDSSVWKHGGGIQSSGNLLAVPFDQAQSSSTTRKSDILLYDVANPENPRLVKTIQRNKVAGTVGITQLAAGGWLMVVKSTSSKELDFYTLDTSYNTVGNVKTWTDQAADNANWCWPGDSISPVRRCGDAYQGLSLINQCDGKLFMIGTHNGNSWGLGGDGADLYSLELDNDSIKVEKIATKELTCKYKCGWFCKNTECNMAAGGGAYVGKDGKLVIYGVEHDNDGPKVGGKGSVKMMEFAEN